MQLTVPGPVNVQVMGYTADRCNRKHVLVVSISLWCLFTAGQAAARSYWQLVVMRVLVGIGEVPGQTRPFSLARLAALPFPSGLRRP